MIKYRHVMLRFQMRKINQASAHLPGRRGYMVAIHAFPLLAFLDIFIDSTHLIRDLNIHM